MRVPVPRSTTKVPASVPSPGSMSGIADPACAGIATIAAIAPTTDDPGWRPTATTSDASPRRTSSWLMFMICSLGPGPGAPIGNRSGSPRYRRGPLPVPLRYLLGIRPVDGRRGQAEPEGRGHHGARSAHRGRLGTPRSARSRRSPGPGQSARAVGQRRRAGRRSVGRAPAGVGVEEPPVLRRPAPQGARCRRHRHDRAGLRPGAARRPGRCARVRGRGRSGRASCSPSARRTASPSCSTRPSRCGTGPAFAELSDWEPARRRGRTPGRAAARGRGAAGRRAPAPRPAPRGAAGGAGDGERRPAARASLVPARHWRSTPPAARARRCGPSASCEHVLPSSSASTPARTRRTSSAPSCSRTRPCPGRRRERRRVECPWLGLPFVRRRRRRPVLRSRDRRRRVPRPAARGRRSSRSSGPLGRASPPSSAPACWPRSDTAGHSFVVVTPGRRHSLWMLWPCSTGVARGRGARGRPGRGGLHALRGCRRSATPSSTGSSTRSTCGRCCCPMRADRLGDVAEPPRLRLLVERGLHLVGVPGRAGPSPDRRTALPGRPGCTSSQAWSTCSSARSATTRAPCRCSRTPWWRRGSSARAPPSPSTATSPPVASTAP